MRAARIATTLAVGLSAALLVWSCGGSAASSDPAESSIRGSDAVSTPSRSVVAADTLANTRIGGPYGTALAFRFRSRWTGVVRGVRVYVVLNSDGRDGYSGGSGGKLRVTLARDSGAPRHLPTRHALAAASVAPPSHDAWPLVAFPKPARVVAGHYYHVVFTNDDPDPRTNYVSINSLLAYGHGEPAPSLGDGMSVLLAGTRDGGRTPTSWHRRSEAAGQVYSPILDVVGDSPAQHAGLGYMEVWSSNPKPIGGPEQVRQLLGAAPSRAITGAWLRVRRRPGATAPLGLRIERVDGGVLASASVPARAVDVDRPGWVHVRFAKAAAAPRGTSLALTAVSSGQGAYEAFPIRKGTEFGFDPRTVFSGGYAQFTNGGQWVGWDQWGTPDRHTGELQFALDTAAR